MKKMKVYFILAIGLLLFAVPGHAALSLYSDSVSVGSGITATESWNTASTSLSWDIVNLGNGWVSYEYTWMGPSKALSHFILQISENATASDFKNFSTPAVGPAIYGPGASNPGIPGSLYGFKFEDSTINYTNVTISFLSTRLPTWGNFYAKDGTDGKGANKNDVYAYNTGFGGTPSGNGLFISVPDTKTVPLPAAVWLLGTSLIGLVGIRRKVRN